MEYKIYQLLKRTDYRFEPWAFAKDKFNMNDYTCVYDGFIEDGEIYDMLESLFIMFNVNRPEDFRGHSLSVSDVISLEGKLYYCDSVSWVELKEYSL